MYSVYLVDDEPWALKLIENGFPWAAYGFEIVGKCKTVEEAGAVLPQLQPDVVVTDIRIAGASGIDLIRRLREQQLDTTVIVLTGYADFHIAQAAIKLDVFDFLLKPIDLEETGALLQKLAAHLRQKSGRKRDAVLAKLKTTTVSDFLRQQGIPTAAPFIRAVTIRNMPPEDRADLPFPALNALPSPSGQATYLMEQNPDRESAFLRVLRPLSRRYSIGISGPAGADEPLSTPVSHAEMIACQPFITGRNDIFFYTGQPYRKVVCLADELLQSRADQTPHTAEWLCNRFVTDSYHMENLAQLIGCLAQSSAVKPVDDYTKLLTSYHDVKEMAAALLDTLHISSTSFLSPDDKSLIYERMLCLVRQRYTEDITLSEIARELNISSSYLSEIFSRYEGTPFSKYLNGLRNARACELLDGTRLSVQEIADLSGFHDYFYFNKQFKKSFGMTPVQYRSRKDRS